MSDTNGGSENIHLARLDRMENVIQSLITLVHENLKAQREMHQNVLESIRESHQSTLAIIRESRAEIHDLIELQKEHRIDIMALFQLHKQKEAL
jgi:hypothetical protein